MHPEITSFDYSWSIVSDPKKADHVESELKNIVAIHSNIALDEINTMIGFEKKSNFLVFGSMEILSWSVFLSGVINLINTTLSNQMARKRENSILRSIGLTQKQLCKMNICEGLRCKDVEVSAASINLGLIPSRPFAQGFMDRLTQGAVQVRLTAEYEGKAVQGIIPIIHKHLDVFEDALREVLSFLHETKI